MKITEDVRQYARENGFGVEVEEEVPVDILQAGMEEMSEKYKQLGNNLYLKDMDNIVNPLEDLGGDLSA